MKSDVTMESSVNEPTGIVDDSGNTIAASATANANNNDELDTPGCTLNHLSELVSSTALWDAKLNGDTTATMNTTSTMSGGSNGSSDDGSHTLALTRKFEELYVKDFRLRSGSFGTVYTCHHRSNSEVKYAVKIMDRKKLKKKDVTAVFREVMIMGELSNTMELDTNDDADLPHYIVQLVDVFVEPGSIFVVQEFAAGGDLFDRLTSRHHYTEKTARDVARQLLETMHFLHSRNIVHRDIKPENLLLKSDTDDTHILVADFGFARHVDPIQKCTTRCGTPSFVAPEILIGVPYGTTVDLWSVGCLLYMLVAGYTPFQAPHHRGLFRKIRAGDFIFHEQAWKVVSTESKRLISNLLTVNSDLRWTAEQALQCAWFRDKKLEERIAGNDLSSSLVGMRQFVPKNAWKRAFHALGFCATAPFWDLDHTTFSQQMSKWDREASAAMHHKSSSNMIHSLPRVKFSDRYELKKKIRKGSYATVWECIHKTSKEHYAVKVIQRKDLKPEDDENVLNEVAIMQSLSADANKYVVQLLDFYEEDDHFFLVMEYCSGGDVFDRIVKYVQYTEMDARALALTLLRAVQSIHKAGLAHRDIKPQNLFLLDKEDNASIRVGDFGFAKRVHTPESLTSRVGTPTYVAPEILKNLPHDERVDLWSVGIVIFVLLVGYPPFLDEDQSVLFKKIRTGEWVFFEDDWANISKEAKDLIRGLLKVDPKERWTIEQCLTCQWINHDPAHLSNNDLTDSIRKFKEKKNRLRGVTVAFKGVLDNIKAYALATTTANSEVPATEDSTGGILT